MCVECVVV